MVKQLKWDELQLPDGAEITVRRWLDRGDGIAVYENQDFNHPDMGHRQFVSYGSPAAMLETAEPPVRLPDIGNSSGDPSSHPTINWRYQLIGIYKED